MKKLILQSLFLAAFLITGIYAIHADNYYSTGAAGSSSVAVGSITGLGTGVETFLATPSSENLRSALTDETGTGAAVFAGGNIGAATATSINGLTISSSTGTLTIPDGVTVTGPGASGTMWTDARTKIKTSDNSKVNNTLADDGELVIAIEANKKYRFRIVALVQSLSTTGTAGFKVAVTCPASPTSFFYYADFSPAGSATLVNSLPGTSTGRTFGIATASGGALSVGQQTTAGYGLIIIEGTINNGSNAGNLVYQFAQNTTDASNASKTLAGSYMEVQRVQ